MSAGGQLAGLNFPNWTGFSGQVLNQGPDRDVNLVMIRAYNDWHVDEWCGAHPDRFIPCGILPLFDVRGGRAGGAPARGQGLSRGHVLGEPGRPRHAEHPHRRVGSAVRRVRATPAPCSAATSGRRRRARRRRPTRPPPVPMNLSSVMAIYTLGDLLWATFWHRFPTLRFALTEGDIGWIPYFLWRAEHTLDRHNGWMRHDAAAGAVTDRAVPGAHPLLLHRRPHRREAARRVQRRQRVLGERLSRTPTARGRMHPSGSPTLFADTPTTTWSRRSPTTTRCATSSSTRSRGDRPIGAPPVRCAPRPATSTRSRVRAGPPTNETCDGLAPADTRR